MNIIIPIPHELKGIPFYIYGSWDDFKVGIPLINKVKNVYNSEYKYYFININIIKSDKILYKLKTTKDKDIDDWVLIKDYCTIDNNNYIEVLKIDKCVTCLGLCPDEQTTVTCHYTYVYSDNMKINYLTYPSISTFGPILKYLYSVFSPTYIGSFKNIISYSNEKYKNTFEPLYCVVDISEICGFNRNKYVFNIT